MKYLKLFEGFEYPIFPSNIISDIEDMIVDFEEDYSTDVDREAYQLQMDSWEDVIKFDSNAAYESIVLNIDSTKENTGNIYIFYKRLNNYCKINDLFINVHIVRNVNSRRVDIGKNISEKDIENVKRVEICVNPKGYNYHPHNDYDNYLKSFENNEYRNKNFSTDLISDIEDMVIDFEEDYNISIYRRIFKGNWQHINKFTGNSDYHSLSIRISSNTSEGFQELDASNIYNFYKRLKEFCQINDLFLNIYNDLKYFNKESFLENVIISAKSLSICINTKGYDHVPSIK